MKFVDKFKEKCNNNKAEEGIFLGITYDLRRLEKIIEDYTRITEISLKVLDNKFNKIASSHSGERSEFCMYIQSTEEGKHKCFCSDELLLKRCAESKLPEIHICHAGLTDAAIPLIKNGEVIGYILLGRIRRKENLGFKNNLVESDNKLISYFNNLVCYDEAELQSAINLAIAITTHILSENIIKKDYDPIIDKAVLYIENNLIKIYRLVLFVRNLIYQKIYYTSILNIPLKPLYVIILPSVVF